MAKRLCYICPVQTECLEYAIKRNEHYGIWGGRTRRERLALKRKWISEGTWTEEETVNDYADNLALTDDENEFAVYVNPNPVAVILDETNPFKEDALTEELTCGKCTQSFSRRVVKGRKPKKCPSCRAA